MPTPELNEKESDFVSRCIPILIKEGKTQEQAAGACYGIFRAKEKIQKSISILSNYIAELENKETRNKFNFELLNIGQEAKKDIDNLTNTGLSMIENIYLRCRKDGINENGSYAVAKNIYNREYAKVNKTDLLRSMEEVLKGIRAKVYKKWQVQSGEWHDYDESGKVITVSPSDVGAENKKEIIDMLKEKGHDIEGKEWDEIKTLYNEEIEGSGGFVDAANLNEKDFQDKKVYEKLNKMKSKEIENLFEKMNFNLLADPAKSFKRFANMTESQLNDLIAKQINDIKKIDNYVNKTVSIGTIHQHKDGHKYKKISEGKWEKITDEPSSEKPPINIKEYGNSWNGKIYGKPNSYNIYVDNKKIDITDEQKKHLESRIELGSHLKSKENLNNKIDERLKDANQTPEKFLEIYQHNQNKLDKDIDNWKQSVLNDMPKEIKDKFKVNTKEELTDDKIREITTEYQNFGSPTIDRIKRTIQSLNQSIRNKQNDINLIGFTPEQLKEYINNKK